MTRIAISVLFAGIVGLSAIQVIADCVRPLLAIFPH